MQRHANAHPAHAPDRLPYDPKKTGFYFLFEFDKPKVGNLVSELLYASPTCYLVSGYQGAGKTSFIRWGSFGFIVGGIKTTPD